MNSTALLIINALLALVILGLIYTLLKGNRSKGNGNELVILQNQLNHLSQTMDSKLNLTNKIINEQLHLSSERLQTQGNANSDLIRRLNENNNKVLQELTAKLTNVEDTNKQIVDFAKQMQSLENILKNPKQRGILGEYFLETMLNNVLPTNSFKMQYSFSDGVIVDAAILIKEMVIPIDAKFSLEGFNRLKDSVEPFEKLRLEKEFIADVKKRIDETSKYVKPEENTINVAFMFIPAEGVYNEVMRLCAENNNDIVGYAYAKRVVLVSPTSFFAYLQTVMQALNNLQIEEKFIEIIKYLNQNTKYLERFKESMDRLGKNLFTVVNTYNKAGHDAKLLSKNLSKITQNADQMMEFENLENIERISID